MASLSGNCTLYVQTDSCLLRNPNTITVTNRGIRVILLNQTTDVVVKFIPQRRIDYTTILFLLVVGRVMRYAVIVENDVKKGHGTHQERQRTPTY